MKANELMVGNYVQYTSDKRLTDEDALPLKVTCVGEPKYPDFYPYIRIEGRNEDYHIDLFQPIPLTDEILDKNFERKEHGWQVKDCWKIWSNPNYGYILATLVMDDFGGGSYEPCIPCTYFHELQNAMTVLRAGKEIKP